ncbi:MAG: VOC family protein [Chloroflexi bacterium]|nr:VOC family protein [Chloroflexota bacterium]
MSKHTIVHVEIPGNNPSETGKFYADLFGWKTEEVPGMDYISFETGEGAGGGFPKVDDQIKIGDVIVYVSTDDIEASLKKAESLGGKTMLPKTEIPGMGWFAWFTDPDGNTLALYTGRGDEE